MSDTESLEYLEPDFDSSSLTVPRLRSILVSHNVHYPSSAKKGQLIELLESEVLPNAKKIIKERLRAKRSSFGIVNAADVEDEEERVRGGSRGSSASTGFASATKLRRSGRGVSMEVTTEEEVEDYDEQPARRRSPVKKTPRRVRASDTETGTDAEVPRTARKSARRSEMLPRESSTDRDQTPVPQIKKMSKGKDARRESNFTFDNPFQSGSSPPAEVETTVKKGRRSSRAISPVKDTTNHRLSTKTNRNINHISSSKVDLPLTSIEDTDIDMDMDENGVEAGEEFTPEAQLELMQEQAANGYGHPAPRRPKKQEVQVNKLAPLTGLFIALLGGYALWYRQEKLAVGYCGVGRSPQVFAPAGVHLPEWAHVLAEPTCEYCPANAYCTGQLTTRCEKDYILKHHPLSLHGLIPIPPTCEPDGEKERRIRAVANRAVEVLEERNAQFECGKLVDEEGQAETTAAIGEEDLKTTVSKQRRKGLEASEFDELWRSAIGEVQGREDISSAQDGYV